MKVNFLPSYRWWLAEKVPREQSTLCPSSRCSPSSTLFCFSVGQIITTIIIQVTIITINFNSSFSLCRKFGHFALEKTVFFVVVQQQWGWLDQFRHFFISPFLFQRFVDTFQLQSNKGGFDMVKTSPIIFFLSFNYSLFYSNIVENTDSTSPI
jgi:hypothetical protein